MVGESITKGLPPQLTSFIGRHNDLAAVRTRLADPACRLLTLVGPGGIGKTRLALEAISTSHDIIDDLQLVDGAFFVSLQAASSLDDLVAAIADVLGLTLSGAESREKQLGHLLRRKSLLLLLDNFEQLLVPSPDAPVTSAGCAAFLSNLLALAPGVRLMVTSREALRLQEEWLYPVEGLLYPSDIAASDLMNYEALQLFAARAQRVQPAFSLREEARAIARICHLVGGMPLALELAATWIKTLSCTEIAAEIERNAAFLSTTLRNVSPRHRSMVAVFDHSWSLLQPDEQAVFQKLSVFRGGFARNAAEFVAGATLPTLAALVDKSMVRRGANGRYQIHELLRQFGEEKLGQTSDGGAGVCERHCHYFMQFLHQRMPDVNDRRQRQAAAAIATELDNVRAAWQWAVRQGDVQALAWGVSTFFYFCQLQSRYLECAEALGAALATLRAARPSSERDFTLTRALTHLGWMYIRLGQFDKGGAVLQESRERYKRLQRPPLPFMGTDPATPLAIVALIQGDHKRAIELGDEARRAAEARQDTHNLSFAHYVLTAATSALGEYETAYNHAERACSLAHVAGNDWFLPYALNEWGNVARAVGNIDEARRHFESSHELKELFEDREGMAVALNHLAELAILQSNYESAQSLYRRALALYQDLNDRGGLATSLKGLGQAAAAMGHDQLAREQFGQALRIAAEIEYWPLVFSLFVDVCLLLQRSQKTVQALEILALVQSHDTSSEEVKVRAAAQLEHCRAQVSPGDFEEAVQRGAAQSLGAAIAALQAVLDLPAKAPQTEGDGAIQTSGQPLDDPLTARELEVLALIAAGKTNAQIAEQLVIATGTTKWYASQIYSKLGVTNRTEAARRATDLGLLA